MTALNHKSVKLPVHWVYLGGSTGPCVRQAGRQAGTRLCALAEKGSNSLTAILISRVLRGLGASPRKIGGKRKRCGARPWF